MSSPLLLIVDDAPEVALIVQRLARRAGQDVCWHPDVPSAWNYLSTGGRPDLLLLDHNLPGPAGVELIRLMRQREPRVQIPVALFGGWERPEDLVTGLEAGAEFIACKELLATPLAWQRRVQEILQGHDGRAAARSVLCQQVRPAHPDPNALERPELILASLNRILHHPTVRRMGVEVLRVLMNRAQEGGLPPSQGWLASHGVGLDLVRLRNELGDTNALAFAFALTEQLWCALGAEALAALQTSASD